MWVNAKHIKNKKIKDMFNECITLYFNNKNITYTKNVLRCLNYGKYYKNKKGGLDPTLHYNNNITRCEVNALFFVMTK